MAVRCSLIQCKHIFNYYYKPSTHLLHYQFKYNIYRNCSLSSKESKSPIQEEIKEIPIGTKGTEEPPPPELTDQV